MRNRSLAENLLTIAVAQLTFAGLLGKQHGQEKLASGEYLTRHKEVYGPKTELSKLRESWTLWRLGDDTFEVVSDWRVERPGEKPATFKTRINLSQDLHPLRLDGLPGLQLTRLRCQFSEKEAQCVAGDEIARLSVQAPYDLYNGIPWILNSIVRRASVTIGKISKVKLLIIDRGGPKSAIGIGAFDGYVSYLGQESIEVAGGPTSARKFELRAHPFPNWLIWNSQEGIALVMHDAQGQVHIELLRYEKFSPF